MAFLSVPMLHRKPMVVYEYTIEAMEICFGMERL